MAKRSAKSKAKQRAKRATPKAKAKRKLIRAKAKARRRPVAKRKAAPRRKTPAKRKTAARKKTVARKKAASRKKSVTRKKAASRKKTVARKKAAPRRKAAPKAKAKRAAKPTPVPKQKSAPSAAPGEPRSGSAGRALKPRSARPTGKTIVLYPEAAFGPALNCVGIAQQLRAMGHNPVFVCDRGFKGVFAKYGFEENLVDMSGGLSDEEIANFWANFIAGHLPHFHLSPIEQLPTYVIPVWEAIVDSAIISHEGLTEHLQRIKPDVVCVDNVILFPAIKRTGRPWIRIISCSENEIADPDIPPHLSGCSEGDYAGYARFENRFLELVRPTHKRFNEFLRKVGEAPYKLGEFFETSPWLNLLLYPQHLRFKRRHPLDPTRFQYLDGCVRDEGRYSVPRFAANGDKPLIYVSFGSLGAADIDLYKRMIALFARLPYRFLMNVGDYLKEYANVPGNVHLAAWYPQPAVLPHVDLFIHHGGNNSFNEALYFGKPAIIMPYCWDGLDNAARLDDTGYGAKLPRYDWTDEQFASTIARLLADKAMAARLAEVSRHMQAAKGTEKAARLIAAIAEGAVKQAA
jgi:MGT family glycosyltransferase